jgi:hypothetical protein
MTEPEQFDVWFDKEYPISGDCGRIKYRESSVRDLMVAAWQASRRAALEEACAAIKAEDDRQSDNDYMLDSDDCIRVIRELAKETNNG